MNNVKEFVLDYIQREYELPQVDDIMNFNYREEGYIDSLGMIMFISSIEDEFGIQFSDDEITSCDIHTIGGLIAKVEEKIK